MAKPMSNYSLISSAHKLVGSYSYLMSKNRFSFDLNVIEFENDEKALHLPVIGVARGGKGAMAPPEF